MADWPFNPGTKEAREMGCNCAVLDNVHGKGFVIDGERCWWIRENCPMHGEPIPKT